MKRSYIRKILDAINEETISFAGGLPSTKMLPTQEMAKCATKVLEDAKALQYSSSYGLEELRQIIAKHYTELLDFPTTQDEILIISGSQQAFDLISKLIKPQELLVQQPTYIGAITAFKALALKLDSYEQPEALKEKLKHNNALYMMSDFQNPSGLSYSQKQRDELACLVNKAESFLIEDGAYSFLSYEGVYQRPIAAQCDKAFHLGSFSKIIAPGLRVGWIRAKKELIKELLIIKESLDLHTATMNQMLIVEFLKELDLKAYLSQLQGFYQSKMSVMCEALQNSDVSFKFEKPKGGMFIYADVNCDGQELAKRLLEKNVAIVPGAVFDIKEAQSSYIRLNFSNASNEQIKEGIRLLAFEVQALQRLKSS